MSLPAELTLKYNDGAYYLCALPIKEIEGIYKDNSVLENLQLTGGMKKEFSLSRTPYIIKLKATLPSATQLTLKIFGRKILCDTGKNSITLSNNTAPLSLNQNTVDLVIVSDQCSIEIYSDGGKFYMGTVDENTFCDYNLPYMEIISSADCEIHHLELHSLKSIWEK
jgi:sucrose-6-phosphate hydrolase SacC (GH32 family)